MAFNRLAMIQDGHASESGGNPQRNVGTEPVNGLRALVAHGAGNKCPRGWGISKPAVYGGRQAHIISLLRSKATAPDAPPGISCSSRMILADTFLILS